MTIIRNFIDFTIKSFEFDKYAGGPFVPTLNRLYTANVNRQTTDKLLFSHAIITDENM